MAVARPTMCWEESSVLVTPQGQTARDQLPLGQCLLAFAVPKRKGTTKEVLCCPLRESGQP